MYCNRLGSKLVGWQAPSAVRAISPICNSTIFWSRRKNLVQTYPFRLKYVPKVTCINSKKAVPKQVATSYHWAEVMCRTVVNSFIEGFSIIWEHTATLLNEFVSWLKSVPEELLNTFIILELKLNVAFWSSVFHWGWICNQLGK